MVYTRQGATTSAPSPRAGNAEAPQPQPAAAGPSRPATKVPQQPAGVTQTPGAAVPQGLGIDVAQIIQQAVQASVQATQAVVQEALAAFRQALVPPTIPVPPAQPQAQMPHQPAPDAEARDDLADTAPGVSQATDMKFLTNFTKQKPPPYDGKKVGVDAEDWLLHTEKILEALSIPDNGQMVRLATYLFHSDVENWWRNVKKARDVTRMSWRDFIKLFYDRHFPRAEREKLANQFGKLEQVSMKVEITVFVHLLPESIDGCSCTQGDMAVDEYSAKFD